MLLPQLADAANEVANEVWYVGTTLHILCQLPPLILSAAYKVSFLSASVFLSSKQHQVFKDGLNVLVLGSLVYLALQKDARKVCDNV